MVTVRFAVFGDVHGQQDLMYEKTDRWQQETGMSLDAILQVGDFETILEEADFEAYFAPRKFHRISDLADYAKGLKEAPLLTIFTGGNHEAWSVLGKEEGFICPQVYYLGRAGVLEIKGIRIGGLTGIFSQDWYRAPLGVEPDYHWQYYRVEEVAVLQNAASIDIFLVHEWPLPLDENVDIYEELNIPQDFRKGVHTPVYNLIKEKRPRFVFAGHFHKPYLHAMLFGTSEFVGLQKADYEKGMCVVEFTKLSRGRVESCLL